MQSLGVFLNRAEEGLSRSSSFEEAIACEPLRSSGTSLRPSPPIDQPSLLFGHSQSKRSPDATVSESPRRPGEPESAFVPKQAWSEAQRQQRRGYAEVAARDHDLPVYDRAHGTRNFCLVGLALSRCASFVCLGFVPWTFKNNRVYQITGGGFTVDQQGQHIFFVGKVGQELVKLALNICIALCTDCLGYVHGTSLRWALYHEDRLYFNSNPRLLGGAHRCSSNRWSTNVVSAFLLMLCYASSGLLFLESDQAQAEGFVLNGIAVSTLGVGMLGQALVATGCLLETRGKILRWSSNPLNTVLTCLHGRLRHEGGRCMMPVHDAKKPSAPTQPARTQQSMQSGIPVLKHIVGFIWVLFVVNLIWAAAVLALAKPWNEYSGGIAFYGHRPALELYLCAVLITVGFQSWLTIDLHCSELVLNISRDERLWRRASRVDGMNTWFKIGVHSAERTVQALQEDAWRRTLFNSGTRSSAGPIGSIKAACTNRKVLVLFGLKAFMHWLLGLSLNMKGGIMYMNWAGILSLSATMFYLACSTTFEVGARPKGPQPAAFGHLQTLADLIDEWDEHTMWWGEKNTGPLSPSNPKAVVKSLHAGTAGKHLRPVAMVSFYAGRP